jgi:hypothetical protein
MYTCYTDTTVTPSATYCDTGMLVVPLNKVAPPKFVGVSKQLLSVCDASITKTIALFSNQNHDYFWQYDNQGVRFAQLRFYPIATSSGTGTNCTPVPVTPSATSYLIQPSPGRHAGLASRAPWAAQNGRKVAGRTCPTRHRSRPTASLSPAHKANRAAKASPDLLSVCACFSSRPCQRIAARGAFARPAFY